MLSTKNIYEYTSSEKDEWENDSKINQKKKRKDYLPPPPHSKKMTCKIKIEKFVLSTSI